MASTQLPPLKHGLLAHSSMSFKQCVPENPAAHEHEYPEVVDVHVAPFAHGDDAHASVRGRKQNFDCSKFGVTQGFR